MTDATKVDRIFHAQSPLPYVPHYGVPQLSHPRKTDSGPKFLSKRFLQGVVGDLNESQIGFKPENPYLDKFQPRFVQHLAGLRHLCNIRRLRIAIRKARPHGRARQQSRYMQIFARVS
jgi:hypothetical protein